jgi:hypothetical protein
MSKQKHFTLAVAATVVTVVLGSTLVSGRGIPPPAFRLASPEVMSASPEATSAALPGQIWPRLSYREVVIPAGTVLPVRLSTSVGSDISRVEQPVSAHLARAIVIDGVTAIPAGSTVAGTITDVRRPGKVKGRAHIGMRFTTLLVGDERYRMMTRGNGWTGRSAKKKDARNIAVPAAGGAVIGALVGGKKGAAIGGAAGGGAGTAYVLSTRGPEVRLGRNAAVSVRLAEPLRVRVPVS